MKTNEHDWKDKAIEYALGLMPEAERQFFVKRMQADEHLRAEVIAIQDLHHDVLDTMDRSIEVPDFAPELLERISEDKILRTRKPGRPYWMWIAASVLFGIAGVFGIRSWIGHEVANAMERRIAGSRAPSGIEQFRGVRESGLNTRLVLSPLKRPGDSSPWMDTLSLSEQKLMQLTVVSESIWELVGLDENEGKPVQRGYILMDMDNSRGYVAIDDMENPNNQILHIWIQLENRRAPVFAGLLPHLNENKGLLYFDFSEVIEKYGNRAIENIFVTGESEVNKEKPQGEILLQNS